MKWFSLEGLLPNYMPPGRLLEKKGFQHDTSGAPVCRWLYKHVLVDIMPTTEEVLGFTNRWYLVGIENKVAYTLSNGTDIYIFPPEIFLASKLEAFQNRGGNDLRQSHDFEDIIYVLENNPDINATLCSSSERVKEYLKSQFSILLSRKDIAEGIECELPYSAENENVKKIIGIMQFE